MGNKNLHILTNIYTRSIIYGPYEWYLYTLKLQFQILQKIDGCRSFQGQKVMKKLLTSKVL
jgi:hypothetical protein